MEARAEGIGDGAVVGMKVGVSDDGSALSGNADGTSVGKSVGGCEQSYSVHCLDWPVAGQAAAAPADGCKTVRERLVKPCTLHSRSHNAHSAQSLTTQSVQLLSEHATDSSSSPHWCRHRHEQCANACMCSYRYLRTTVCTSLHHHARPRAHLRHIFAASTTLGPAAPRRCNTVKWTRRCCTRTLLCKCGTFRPSGDLL